MGIFMKNKVYWVLSVECWVLSVKGFLPLAPGRSCRAGPRLVRHVVPKGSSPPNRRSLITTALLYLLHQHCWSRDDIPSQHEKLVSMKSTQHEKDWPLRIDGSLKKISLNHPAWPGLRPPHPSLGPQYASAGMLPTTLTPKVDQLQASVGGEGTMMIKGRGLAVLCFTCCQTQHPASWDTQASIRRDLVYAFLLWGWILSHLAS